MRAELSRLPSVLAVLAIVAQLAYPLTHHHVRNGLTIAIVLVFAAASASHALLTAGVVRGGSIVLLSTVGGFGVEVLGVHSHFPFGEYRYSSTLGPRLFDVPVVIGAAWTMLAWPAAVVARRLASSFAMRVVIGAWALAAWDVFLDPQMVADGHWHWRFPSPHLPGVSTVPLTNYAGWLLVALVMSVVMQGIAGSRAGDDRVPIVLYLWTWVGSVVAFLAFLDLEAAAGWGGLAMGVVAVPLLLRLVR